ncbi:glycosyl transferase [Erysipelatoclostridium sp. An15]|uniref:glycosyltransferase family 2 protein n=1 Tax=Erysipelatoclostridium sp. An15 TaxID=1965566 RepID=UPI000B36A533|nr:glycosyltransferase family 2 protein [Erysipelatoclostridium sp. An15]OUQ05201.1 glycosyl transferase [Erysipelatoclostridium sp. An15]
MEDLVSIIMPAYNAEKYIGESIESVLNQTYQNWELMIVNDCSIDNTANIIKNYADKDSRIKYFHQKTNSGAALARNKGIELANGKYIAFLDSDDLWKSDKLQIQISYMSLNNCDFTCTYYDKINETGESLNKIIKYEKLANYYELLKNCPGNSTVIYDASKLGKIYAKNIKRRNDYILWLDVIKKSNNLQCIDQVLGSHRVVAGSISSNKIKLIKYHWEIYRNFERLNIFYSLYLVIYWILKGIVNKVC